MHNKVQHHESNGARLKSTKHLEFTGGLYMANRRLPETVPAELKSAVCLEGCQQVNKALISRKHHCRFVSVLQTGR